MSNLMIKKPNDISTENDYSIISREFTSKYSNKRNQIINYVADSLKATNNIRDIINPKIVYIAKFSKSVLEKMESGQYDIRMDKNGEALAEIIDTTLPKNGNLVHILRLEKSTPNNTQSINDLGSNLASISTQQQLANLSELLLQVQTIVIEVKRGQMTDRIGQVLGGKNQLEQAMDINDNKLDKKDIIIAAITSMNEGRSKIESFLNDEIGKIVNVPSNKFAITAKSLFRPSWYSDIEDRYYSIQEGMYSYFEATRLLALSYTITDNKEAIHKVLEPVIPMIEKSYEKMKRMSTVIVGGPKTRNNWYENGQKIIEAIKKTDQLVLPEDVEYISLEISGKELLREGNHD